MSYNYISGLQSIMHPNQLPQYPKMFSKDGLPHSTYLKVKHREVKQFVQDNEHGSGKKVRSMSFICQPFAKHANYFLISV